MGMTAKRDTRTGIDVPASLSALAAAARAAGEPVSVRGLARELGVSASTVSRWARGICRPNAVNVAKLADLVDGWHGYAINRKAPALSPAAAVNVRIVGYTQAAYDALMSDDDRREIEELAARIAASIETLHAVNGV